MVLYKGWNEIIMKLVLLDGKSRNKILIINCV